MAKVSQRIWTHKGVENRAWVCRYRDPTGSYRSRQFDKKKDADRYRLQIENELDGGTHIARSQSRTLAEATKLFLEDIDTKVAIGAMRPTTGLNYHAAFRQAIIPALGHRLMLEIDSSDIEAWYHSVVRSKRMKAVTANRRLWFIKALFEFAIRRKWVRKGCNPAIDAMSAVGRPKETRIDTFDLEGVRRVIAAANERRFNGRQRSYEASRLAVNLAAFCGLRWGEIHGLTVTNIDLEGKVLLIRHSLDRLGNLQEPKTKAGRRDVPMPSHLAQMLTEFLARWPVTNPEGIVFATERGTPQMASNFHKQSWYPLLSRAGVASPSGGPIHFHALRHFAVSWMIENGWPITDVSEIIGHANVSTTLQVYAHVIKGRRQSAEAMQSLAEKLLADVVAVPTTPLLIDATATQEIETAEYAEVLEA